MLVRVSAAIVVVLVASLMAAAQQPAGAQATSTPPGDTTFIVKDGEPISNIDVALAVIAETPLGEVDTIVVSRDDNFADALASGVLQDGAPLVLVPSTGELPDRVSTAMSSLAPTRAIILGGEQAVSSGVADQLTALGMAVERRAGATRFETAIEVARRDAADADTIILARAFAAPGSTDPTQAFADTLAAGGLSARTGWPILLTETDQLTAATRDYLASSAATNVIVVGGAAAVGEAVLAEAAAIVGAANRLAGASRADTAVQIAAAAGDETAAEAERVIVTDGQDEDAWAAGFALASHAAHFDAPIVLTLGGALPPETQAFLSSGIGGGSAAAPVITCTFDNTVCEDARTTAGLPPVPGGLDDLPPATVELSEDQPVTFDLAAQSGDVIAVGFDGIDPAAGLSELCIDGTLRTVEGSFVASLSTQCIAAGGTGEVAPILLDEAGPFIITLTSNRDTSGSATVYVNGAVRLSGTPDLTSSAQLSRPGDVQVIAFPGRAGEVISIGLDSLAPRAGIEELCLGLRLYDPLGDFAQSFTASCGAAGSTVDRDPLILEDSGTHTLQVYADRGTTGTAQVFVNAATETASQPDVPPQTIDLSRPGDVHIFRFDGDSGQHLSVGFDELTPRNGIEELCLGLRLYDPFDNFQQSFSDSCGSAGATLDVTPFLLEESGSHLLQVYATRGSTGTAQVFLNAATETASQPDVPPQTIDLSRPGDVHIFRFDGDSGQHLSVGFDELTPRNGTEELCLGLRLYDPFNNFQQSFTDSCGPDGATRDVRPFRLEESGSHTLEVFAARGTTGSARAHLNAAVEHDVAIGDPPLNLDLRRPGDLHVIRFDAQVTDSPIIELAGFAPSAGVEELCIGGEVRDPFGNRQDFFGDECGGAGHTGDLGQADLEEAGIHELIVHAERNTTGTATLRLRAG